MSRKPKDPLKKNTPVEKYDGVYVKREDLCASGDWPKFSKARGVLAHVALRGEKVIGVLDTFHSQAGWAVAAACKHLGKDCINFYPKYKGEEIGELRRSQRHSKALGAGLVALQAGRSAILYHQARHHMKEWGYLMPNALKLQESIDETAREVHRTKTNKFKHVIIPISSGTIAAGVLKGLAEKKEFPRIIIHMGYTRSKKAVWAYLAKHAPRFPMARVKLVDEGYAYSDTAREGREPGFPCNIYYDLKAWRWLMRKQDKEPLKGRILFWNIGS
jgi:1-aminocyclopropane-1-carboxylate deaminase/D-cysteine desulfhydrase-like pyridoxal-dependent ACC family enzyme